MPSLATWMDNITNLIVMPMIMVFALFVIAKGWRYAVTIQTERFESGVKNILLMLINGTLIAAIAGGSGALAQYGFGGHWPRLDPALWAAVPFPLAVIFTVIALDFTNYWNHRVLHHKWLWGIHAIHHSDKHINWTTTYRVHLFEVGIMFTGLFLITGWMSLPIEALGAAGLIHAAYNKYVHSQLGWMHGPLRKWLISPNYHRWHHADDPAAYNRNFGDMCAVWDRMFGTHYDGGRCEAPLGVDDGPETVPDMLAYPFVYTWRNIRNARNSNRNVVAETAAE